MDLLKVREALDFGSEKGCNGKNLFSEAKASDKWEEFKSSDFYSSIFSEVRASEEKFSKEPIKALPFSTYKLFEETGSRKEYEALYFEKRERLLTYALLALSHGDGKSLEALEDIIWAICDEYTWCLPAHIKALNISNFKENRLFDDSGDLLQDFRSHKQEIDLFSAETAFALAEILNLLEDKLKPIVVYRAKKEIKSRIFEPYCSFGSPFWWETCDMNWGSVCAGSIGIAAMYLIKDNGLLAQIIHRVIGTMECYFKGFDEDGVCLEGLGYWNYGFSFFVAFAALLKQRTYNSLDLFLNEKIKKIALFQQVSFLYADKIISFSDASTESKFNLGLTQYLKDIYEEVTIPDQRYRSGFRDDNCYRWGSFIRNIVWSSEYVSGEEFREGTCFFKGSEWLVSKKAVDGVKISFAAKGGNNNEPHNHNDVGNFILNINGDTFITDTGAGEYTKQYFGPERYSIFCNGSQGHNVPVIDGKYQCEGQECHAKIINLEISCDKAVMGMDISDSYKIDNLEALKRSFVLNKDLNQLLVLTDDIQFKNSAGKVYERFITFYKPEADGKGIVSIKGEKGTLQILFDNGSFDCKISKELFTDHYAVPQDIYTIDINNKKPEINNRFEITFKYLPM